MARSNTFKLSRIALGLLFLALILLLALEMGSPNGQNFRSLKVTVALLAMMLGGLIAVVLWRYPRLRRDTNISELARPVVKIGTKNKK